ncbi:putative alpha-glucosidase protein [Rhizobium freirei PRF 81]|uniref:Putative alpha-glucosidase protein n=2 Tax=Rhizobium freirei TaxID=1353277 RepID=N6V4D1_9HYPH|nr:putative alpha-glucosidase protein [Rhizobium freirei PRF 81]
MPWEASRAHAGFTTADKSWLPVPYQHAALAADRQEADKDSVLHHYRQTLAFRSAHAALRDGDMTFLDTEEDVLAFTRSKDGGTLLFVFNLSRKPVKVVLPKDIKLGKTIAMPGFTTADAGSTVALAALDVFCAQMG